MRALVVEDHPGIRRVLVDTLAARGYAVTACADAETAFAAVQEAAFELVLLDVGLPGADGLELCRKLRVRPDGQRIAVLVLTGSLDPADLNRIVAAGADDYLAKPFAVEHLALRLAFAERRLARAAERDRAEAVLAAEGDLLQSLMDHVPDLLYVKDPASRFTRVNRATARFLGLADPADAVGKTDFDFFPERLARQYFADEQRVVASGEPILNTLEPQTEDESTWFLTSTAPLIVRGDVVGLVGVARDVTARKQAEDLLARQAQELALLDRVRTALAQELEVPPILRAVVEAVADAFGYTQVSTYLRDEAAPDVLVLQHQIGYDRVIERIPLAAGVAGRVAQSGEPELHEDVRAVPEFLGAIDGITSELCVPLRDQGQVVGVLNVESTGGVVLTEADLALMLRLAQHVGIAIGRARLYQLARANEERYRILVEQMPAVTYVEVNVEGASHLRYVSPQVTAMLGYAPDEYAAAYGSWVDFVHPDDRPEVLAADARTNATGEPFRVEYRHRTRDGRWVWVRDEAVKLPGAEDAAQLWQGVLFDITARKVLEQRLAHEATHDPLTLLPNRVLFADRLEQALRRNDDAVAVLFVDLDDFKVVNDTLGHEAGDRLLVEVARRVGSCVRSDDVVARLGGDEFAVLLQGRADAGEVTAVAQRIAACLMDPVVIDGRQVAVGASVGVAASAPGRSESEDLLRGADLAMYAAKRTGKGRHAVFAPGMEAAVWERLDLEADLRRALTHQEFEVYYQPVVRLATGEVAKVEALVRWRHPVRGQLRPGEFVAVAEETGAIVPLGWWVLNEACNQVRAWQQRFAVQPPLAVSVNLSARQLRDPALVQEVAAALEASGLAPACLELELTERAFVDDADAPADVLRRLRDLGVRLALDDFGAGYASLGYLRRLPIDVLKLDRSLVAGLGRDPTDTAIVRAIVELGRVLGMQVTAEGIETAAQLDLARLIGCALAQGHQIAPPLPGDEVAAFLASRTEPAAAGSAEPDWLRAS